MLHPSPRQSSRARTAWLSTLLPLALLAQTPVGDASRAEFRTFFADGESASAAGDAAAAANRLADAADQFCHAAAAFQNARSAADGLKDNQAHASAALNLAEVLEKVPAGRPCTGAIQSPEQAYRDALAFGNSSQKAVATNGLALLEFAQHQRKAAVEALEELERNFEKDPAKSGIDPQDMAVYQYNLGRIYEASAPADWLSALEHFKKALRNKPNFPDAGSHAFAAISEIRSPKPPAPIQAAELATLLIEGGQPEVAAKYTIAFLPSVVERPSAQVLVGVLLRSYLARPLDPKHFQEGDWPVLQKVAAGAAGTLAARSITQLGSAYIGPMKIYRNEQEAAEAFSAWINGPSSVIALATLLRRRGSDEEHNGNPANALGYYSTAWYLDPANTESAVLSAALLKVNRDLAKGTPLIEELRTFYLPPHAWYGYVVESFKDTPLRDELRLSAGDYSNIRAVYEYLTPEQDRDSGVILRLKKEAARAAEAKASSSARPLRIVAGDRTITGTVSAGSQANGVYIEVRGGEQSDSGEEIINEVAVADVNPATRQYTVELLRSPNAGEIVAVYPITYGIKSDQPESTPRVEGRGIVSLRHVHAFVSAEGSSDLSKPLAFDSPRVEFLVQGAFRVHNHGQPYLPYRVGLLVTPYAAFALTPFSVTQSTGSPILLQHARSFESGLFLPYYGERTSRLRNGSPNSIFFAPIVKLGFHAAGEDQSRTFYKYGAAGFRWGGFRFARYGERVPALTSHFDITAGKWQNLSAWDADGRHYVPLRAEFSGQFFIVSSLFYVGFLQTTGPGHDHRVMAGVRFDVSKPLSSLLRVDR